MDVYIKNYALNKNDPTYGMLMLNTNLQVVTQPNLSDWRAIVISIVLDWLKSLSVNS